MTEKSVSTQRTAIIESVKSPLGFFTLVILAAEGMILALSARASGVDFTLLVIGALVGFVMIIVMVFFLTLNPGARHALLGSTSPKITGRFGELRLSANDHCAMIELSRGQQVFVDRFGRNSLGSNPKSPTQRAKELQRLGLVDISEHSVPIVSLTDDGAEIVRLVEKLFHDFQVDPLQLR